MTLNLQVCSRARLSRDARFDGKFFIAVRSTGIYCRPICPARSPKESNVVYFSTAAAAAEAGFRPCLRCRPECSPGTPAWLGTPSTVARALRLIDESGLEDGGVEVLAERLGIGSRHLRRLFLRHLGATPRAVANTRRLHFAKKLIDETSLPMNQVALAAGFGTVRRFNVAIQTTYHRTPTHIRRLARQSAAPEENHYVFQLRFRPPYHWQGMLSFLELRAIPGVEAVRAGLYRRSIYLNGSSGHFAVAFDPAKNALIATIHFGDPRSLFAIVERIRALFDLTADWSEIAQSLKGDEAFVERLEAAPGLRVPGAWDGFELAVRAILGQQITVKGATTLAGRIVKRYGKDLNAAEGLTHLFPTPEILAEADLTCAGLTKARAATIRELARAVSDGKIRFEGILDADEFRAKLCQIPGIGAWTSQYIAMRALREPDAFPVGDIALVRSLGLANARELERRAEQWRPWRAYAAMYLWNVAGKPKSESGEITHAKTNSAANAMANLAAGT
jgi:AraC family transcriptional regulator, regulatory protein of adaptative response / DNA-3-methyladenine glycosylase II